MTIYDDMVETVLKERYYKEGETWEDLCKRVASIYPPAFKYILRKQFLPNSPCLMNAPDGMMSACFVLPVDDSIPSIFKTLQDTALIHKEGGGTGFNFSNLRPEGSKVKSTNGVASGPVSFMKVFNATTEVIKQGGKRRGANMGILFDDHPDIHKFLQCKKVEGELANFNISVMIRSFPLMEEGLLREIAEGIHRNGEPGVLFFDTINKTRSNVPKVEATNPCGEVGLLPYESCNLGSINLSAFVQNGVFQEKEFMEVVRIGVRFLDGLIDKQSYVTPEIEKATKLYRNIGLGVMGYHDMLIKLKLKYGVLERIMRIFRDTAWSESQLIAIEKGTYPAYVKGLPYRRNYNVTCIAPTGTISMIAGCSSGIEPNFSYTLTRKVLGKEYTFPLPICEYNPDLSDHAYNISPETHINVQGEWQRYIDSSISKTINLPSETSVDEIEWYIKLAYQRGCKGITMYREHSRKEVVLSREAPVRKDGLPFPPRSDDQQRSEDQGKATDQKEIHPLDGSTYYQVSGCCNLYVTVNDYKGEPWEVFVQSSGGGCSSMLSGLSRMISLALQSGVSKEKIAKSLSKTQCPACIKNTRAEGLSCSDVIGKCLLGKMAGITTITDYSQSNCPECGKPLTKSEGCVKCLSCGYSKCG